MTRTLRVWLPAALVLGALPGLGCRKHETRPGPAPSAPPGAPAPSASLPGSVTLAELVAAADVRVEASRGVVALSDPALAARRAALQRHFGAGAGALRAQVARIGSDRSAVLMEAERGEPNPVLWFLTDGLEVLWERDRAMGGVKPGATSPALSPGPERRVALSWCNAATSSVALRQWTEDGGAFADFEALHYDSCEALSVLYWPHHGWLVGVAGPGGLRVQLVGEDGDARWGRDGTPLPWTWRSTAVASFGLDTEDTVLLFRLGGSGASGSAEYVFASRFDASGRPMWPGPVSVQKVVEPVPDPLFRIALFPGPSGTIATNGVKVRGAGAPPMITVASDATVERH